MNTLERLTAKFPAAQVKCRPAVVSANRALAYFYLDPQAVEDRLSEVLSVQGWQVEYEAVPDGSVICKLKLLLEGEWVTKMAVGGNLKEGPDGQPLKSADRAFLEAALKFGIGRYLQRLPGQWVDYDPQRRAFVHPPVLPESCR